MNWFTATFVIYTIYCFTTVFRWLPAIAIQMPIIMLCYFMLVLSVKSHFGNEQTIKFFIVSFLIIVFNFIFIYLQSYPSSLSLVNKIGANFTLFVTTFPVLLIYSGGFENVDKKRLRNIVFFIVLITAITTIIGTYNYISPSRLLATNNNPELTNVYKQQNIGGYGFIYSIVLLCPLILKKLINHFSFFLLVFILICSFCVIRSEYTTAILLLIAGIAISLSIQRNAIIGITSIIIVGALALKLEDILNWGIVYFSESYTVSSRLSMILGYIKYDVSAGNLLERKNLYNFSFNSFLRNPIFGGLFRLYEVNIGGHSEILDYIGHSGLFGLIVLFIALNEIRKIHSFRLVKKDTFFIAMIIIAIFLAVINTFSAPELLYTILIMPVLLDDNETNNDHNSSRYTS